VSIQVQTAQNVGIDLEVAGVGERILATLIDYAVLFSYFLLVTFAIALITPQPMVALVFLSPLPFYFLICEVFFDGQSIGKHFREIKVVRLDGGVPSFWQYALRWILRLIDMGLAWGAVAVCAVMFTERSQRLGDLAAGTTVVRIKPVRSLGETIFAAVEEEYDPVFSQVEYLTEDDVQLARDVLDSMIAEGRTVRSRDLGRKLKASLEARMGIHSDLHPEAFLRTVIRDFNAVQGRV
jgi:uncharacterized RDD family membrane protein YckC